MKLLVALTGLMMVMGAVAQERCGCNKPRPSTPKQTPVAKQQPAPAKAAPARQCAAQKPCPGKPARAA